jgi:membrane protein
MWQQLIKLPGIRHFILLTKKVSLPGFDGVPIYDVVTFFGREIMKDVITDRAAAISFSFFLAIFPAIIFVFTLIPYIPITDLQVTLLETINGVLPESVYGLVSETIEDIIKRERGGLLSFGFLAALVFATNGMNAVMNSFDKTYIVFKQRNWLTQRWMALQLTLIVFLVVLLSVAGIIAGRALAAFMIDLLGFEGMFAYYLFQMAKWTMLVLMLFFSFASIYYFGPATKRSWKFFSPGVTLATILSIASSVAFSSYVNNFELYNKIYGSIGTIIALMFWIYINSLVLLVGFEVNASISVNKSLRS